MKTTRLQVVLRDVVPAVVRVIDIPASSPLPELHQLLQAAIGWTDSHLHQFVTPQATYGMVIPGEEVWPEDQRDETEMRLADLGTQFDYVYDFGDGWTHEVKVLGRGGPSPGCVDGHGACPPEDCGGPGGYAELLEALADPAHLMHERLRGWIGNRLRPFDLGETNQRVLRVVGEVPESVRLLLDLLADGVKLTPAGRLPRTVVRAVQAYRPHWYPLDRPVSTEDNLPPLVALHSLLREVGLVRLRNGILTSTKTAGDDLAVVRRLRSVFESGDFTTEVTELTIGVLAAHGPLPLDQLAARVHPLLGYGWQLDGRPLDEHDVWMAIAQQSPIMTGLDMIDHPDFRAWAIGASALSLLPRAAMLGEMLTDEE